MKNSILYILLLAIAWSACNKGADDRVFPEPADERLNSKLADYQSLLTAAPNGWKMTVIPADTSQPYIFYLWMKFSAQNRVTSNMDTLPAQESSYRLKAMMQPELIFDTYSYLHRLSDATPSPGISGAVRGKGLMADFEYEIRYVSPDSIVLYGKYNKSYARLIKAAPGDSAGFTRNLFRQNNYLSGAYTSSGNRKLYTGALKDSILGSTANLSGIKQIMPVYPGTYAVDYADLGGSGWKYLITFDPVTKAITSVKPDNIFAGGILAGSFQVLRVSYDDAKKQLYLKTIYVNTAGSGRITEETLTKN
ncbi:DUF4302 domain-containing protein [Chitinophaga sp. Mgbs1]|uniref:DUF4302 domain-containing protein n=1 Tax=Chitinophaga solisilvae TaxID=1233460 RepID=A0A3S1D1P4_9BACT|nr:DUF4302 domain-containing protein [Chitinophaga solisilvae]